MEPTIKIGELFDLPEKLPEGHIGIVTKESRVIAKYEVVKVGDDLKGRIIVTYNHKRRKQ